MIKLPAEIDVQCDTENCNKTAVFIDEETEWTGQYLCLLHAEKLERLRERLMVVVV